MELMLINGYKKGNLLKKLDAKKPLMNLKGTFYEERKKITKTFLI